MSKSTTKKSNTGLYNRPFPFGPPLYRNVYDAIEIASMIDPRDRAHFYRESTDLGIYYESRHLKLRPLMQELVPDDPELVIDLH